MTASGLGVMAVTSLITVESLVELVICRRREDEAVLTRPDKA
jgi:hypothetical protein